MSCADFEMLSDEACEISASYNRCNDSWFECTKMTYDPNGDYYEDCSDAFTDASFWAVMR